MYIGFVNWHTLFIAFADISRLTPIKEQLPDYIEFNHIKVVIAVLQNKYGMTDTKIDEIPDHGSSAATAKPIMVKVSCIPRCFKHQRLTQSMNGLM